MRALPNDGAHLVPKLCVGSASADPVMRARCANAGTHYELPAGDSCIVVFSDTGNVPPLHGAERAASPHPAVALGDKREALGRPSMAPASPKREDGLHVVGLAAERLGEALDGNTTGDQPRQPFAIGLGQ